MTFLFPLFLAAGAAVLAPLVLHLRRQPPTNITEFSSLLFLEPSAVVTTTKRRLERWWLLLLRCLCLALLALMFARPYLENDPAGGTASHGTATLILLDQSASMSRENLWPAALERVYEHIADASPTDQLAVATFSSKATLRANFTELESLGAPARAALVKKALAELKPDAHGTRLDTTLIAATHWLDETRQASDPKRPPPAKRQIVLISDLQQGASISELSRFTWPQDVTLQLDTVAAESSANLALALAADDENADPAASANLRLRLTSAADSPTHDYQLILDGQTAAPKLTGRIAPGTTRILRLPRPTDDKPHTISLSGDDWTLDDAVHVAPLQPERPLVLAVAQKADLDDPAGSLYYLKRALQPTPLIVPTVTTDVSEANWSKAQWIVLVQDAPHTDLLPKLRSFAEKGGHVLVLVASAEAGNALSALIGAPIAFAEAASKEFALLTNLDTKDPTLQAFADPRLANFSQLHIWHRRSLTALLAGASVIASYDDGRPALFHLPVGKGRVHILTTTWAPADSQLALVPQFIPLLYSLLQQTSGRIQTSHQLTTGQPLPGTDQVAEKLGTQSIEGTTYAINLPPEESRLAPMSASVLAALSIPLREADNPQAAATAVSATKLALEALENQQQYWLIILAALLWMVGLETWLANRKLTT